MRLTQRTGTSEITEQISTADLPHVKNTKRKEFFDASCGRFFGSGIQISSRSLRLRMRHILQRQNADLFACEVGASTVGGECISHAKPQRTRRGLNSLTEEFSSSEDSKSHQNLLPSRSSRSSRSSRLRGFAASREKNLLSKFAPNCGCNRAKPRFERAWIMPKARLPQPCTTIRSTCTIFGVPARAVFCEPCGACSPGITLVCSRGTRCATNSACAA